MKAYSRFWVISAVVLAGCASAQPVPPAAAPAASATALPNDIKWARHSAEHRAAYLQAFRLADTRVTELAQGLAPKSWAIITDADETVIDNSEFEEMRALNHLPYSDSLWNVFVNRQVSTALPGAVAFFDRVHQLGGRVVVVTNRAASLCDVTRSNLQKVGLSADLVICQPPAPATGDKNPRFRAVQQGTAAPGVPALRVVLWLGDNIQDFPNLTQAIRKQPDNAFDHFGRDYILLPNPMYGSWERNPD